MTGWMGLQRLTLENFRGFERLELDLDAPTILLVGVNGSGKTSILDAITLVLTNILGVDSSSIQNVLRLGAESGLRRATTGGDVNTEPSPGRANSQP
jgi:DNA repair exonuclease SbcCD ATPase subunit